MKTIRKNLHYHRCPKCHYLWCHTNAEGAFNVNGSEHDCPKCGTEQCEKAKVTNAEIEEAVKDYEQRKQMPAVSWQTGKTWYES